VRDPHPDNISGEKHVQHVVEHSVDWGHVALGLAGIFVAWKLAQLLDGDDEGNDEVDGVCTGD
jgi:hypothetical protein